MTKAPLTRAEVEELRDKILELPPARRLRLAAELIEQGKYMHAEPIVRNVADELTVLRLFGQRDDPA